MENRPHRLHPVGAYMSESERLRQALREMRTAKRAGIWNDILICAMVFVCASVLGISIYVSATEDENESMEHETQSSEQLPNVRK